MWYLLNSYWFHNLECDYFTFGEQCLKNCTCDLQTAKGCNTMNGTCHCMEGWMGSNCTQDVDECKNTSYCDAYLEDCYNEEGSASCECRYGNVNRTDNECVCKW